MLLSLEIPFRKYSIKACVLVQAHEESTAADFKMLCISLTSDLSHFRHLEVPSTSPSPRLPLKSMERAEDFQGTIYPPFLDTKDNMSHTSKGACLSPLTTEKVKIFTFLSISEINSTHNVCIKCCDLKKTYTI